MKVLATILEYASDEGSLRKPYAGNPHVRFDEEGGSGLPDLLYSTVFRGSLVATTEGTEYTEREGACFIVRTRMSVGASKGATTGD